MASEAVQEFNDANFQQEVLDSDKPVLVDFWAEWCAPCRMLAPTIEKLATDLGDTVKVGKLDTDANRGIAGQYRITSIPTVMLFKNGEVVEQFIGLRDENDYKAAIEQHS
jgi:thioredoxin 1